MWRPLRAVRGDDAGGGGLDRHGHGVDDDVVVQRLTAILAKVLLQELLVAIKLKMAHREPHFIPLKFCGTR